MFLFPPFPFFLLCPLSIVLFFLGRVLYTLDGLSSAKMLQSSFSLQHALAWLGILLGGGVFYVSSLMLQM